MKSLILILTVMLAAPQERLPLVVHEWGTFTSVSGQDGVPMSWRPLDGPIDLPNFVYSTGRSSASSPRRARPEREISKGDLIASVRMETPVLYFYSDQARDVSVKVDFPAGQITEWYPAAVSLKEGIDWGKIRVLPGESVPFPVEKNPSHYYPARETDAAPVRSQATGTAEHEKFLFYRGVGWFALPLRVRLEGNRVTVKNTGEEPISGGFLFERRGGKSGYRVLGPFGGEILVDRPELREERSTLAQELEETLRNTGLYEKEARAMIETWRDSWFEDGLRVMYVLPRRFADAVLPLHLDPRPETLVRVLVGRAEVITPQMEETMIALVKRLDHPSAPVREEAQEDLKKFGRFAQPVLARAMARTSDLKVKSRIVKLLQKS